MLKNQKFINSHKKPTAVLILENGQIFWGYGIGAKKYAIGELCFNTAQTGYQEILTDPSYAKQIITFTFPHIGIVGTNNIDNESNKIHASGCVINQPIDTKSNWRSKENLDFFFTKNNIVCITNIDTRKITRLLATKGSLKSVIFNFGKKLKNLQKIKKELNKWKGLKNLDLAKIVSTKERYNWQEGKWLLKENSYQTQYRRKKYKIICLDYGIKRNILRNLFSNNFNLQILNSQSSFEEIFSHKPDGIFLSNGPGDPFATASYAVPTIKKLINKKIPIFGICLGHQLLGLALGAKTKKMFQGHRGANHPVINLKNRKVEITSQNHGFEIDRNSFPKDIIETHISLFDNTNEGFKHKKLPVFSVQYHPESSPGPHDSIYLFREFENIVKKYAKKK